MLNFTKLFLLFIIIISSTEIYSQQSTDTLKVLLRFSEPMSRDGIFDIANYQIVDTLNQQIRIYKVGVVAGDSAVVLFTENIVRERHVTISVINLKDKSGNIISEDRNIASLPSFKTQ